MPRFEDLTPEEQDELRDHLGKLPTTGNRKYPWAEWEDGSVWVIRKGEDFTMNPQFMQTQVNARARSRGRKAWTKRVGEDVIMFQFEPDED